MKIAIIGSGISGMTAGHLLAPHHEVHLFEADSRLGGHTHTHEVEVASGKYKVDTGFIVHNTKNYPQFLKLMSKIGVATQSSDMSFSVKVEKTGLEYNGTTLNSLFCQRRNLVNLSFYRMIFDIIRFNKEATKYYLSDNLDDSKTLEDYLRENRYSEEFTETYIMPMGAAIWSASRDEMRKFPLGFFVRFFHHHGMLTVDDRPEWRTLVGGSKSYITPLTANFARNIHLNSPVVRIQRHEVGITVVTPQGASDFDEVIFACHADTAMKIMKDEATLLEKEVMSGFSYRPNDVLLHTDTSVLPRTELGHAAWNYYLPSKERDRVALTYHMNILQNLKAPEKFLVSLNMDDMIDPKKVIKAIPYFHPVYTLEAVKSQSLWSSISGKERIHFCGAYWGNGFHEDGVKSGIKVAESLGVTF